jgi:UDP-N-acetylglucosamine 2-epimerase (non-hydrolysing)
VALNIPLSPTFPLVRVLCVAGARPNFVKVKPVLASLQNRGAETLLVHTGQHYDHGLDRVFFDDLGIRAPDHHLEIGSGSQAAQVAKVLTATERLLGEVEPDVMVVVGDVNSTMAAALAGAKSQAVVAHVEAGLRSRDWGMPEEINRVVTDRVSDVLLASSADAVANLAAEGCPADRVRLVGNVMVDTLLANLDRARARPVLADLGVEPGEYGVLTLHRPSNVDDPAGLAALLAVLGEIAAECPLVFPVHPRTRPQLETILVPDGIRLVDPIGYLDFLALQASARLVLTDSGGVQEETTVLGVPCLTLRTTTERPITVDEGTNVVVGVDPDRILAAARRALDGEVPARRPALWDGKAGERIASVLLDQPLPPKGWWAALPA